MSPALAAKIREYAAFHGISFYKAAARFGKKAAAARRRRRQLGERARKAWWNR